MPREIRAQQAEIIINKMPERTENLGQMDLMIQAFSGACALPWEIEWNCRETTAFQFLSDKLEGRFQRADVFFGGDSLRPYLAAQVSGKIWIISYMEGTLSRPQLIEDLNLGKYGLVKRKNVVVGLDNYVVRLLPNGGAMASQFAVPNVYLTSLTNASRYQTRRYPLNIGRLGQWLRFQHAGRVKVVDLALNFDGNNDELFNDIQTYAPDILGISINFGEGETFRKLILAILKTDLRPVICLGNVLPAWSPAEIRNVCDGFDVYISNSYGEVDLEDVCRSFGQAKARNLEAYKTDGTENQTNVSRWPQVMVLPDEHLLSCTLEQSGQASIETSFGCQYSRCSFCPREHRGKSWQRPAMGDVTAVVNGMATRISKDATGNSNILSLVDEDAFGEEGVTPGIDRPSIIDLVTVAGNSGVSCEIYTRLEQIFDRRRESLESLNRIEQLLMIKPHLARVFVGVESGSDSQLRRYAKGQSAAQVIDALRVGALLGLPLEFGFITFDPLLTQEELVENLEFLARRDVLLKPEQISGAEEIYSRVISRRDDGLEQGEPIFARVAYMATELEMFSNSPYFKRLAITHPGLVGEYESSFSRYDYSYQDPVISSIATWCRVWTESTFRPMYRMRLASRTIKNTSSNPFSAVVHRYREATYGLLLILTERFANLRKERISRILRDTQLGIPTTIYCSDVSVNELQQLWQWIASAMSPTYNIEPVGFSLDNLKQRRDA